MTHTSSSITLRIGQFSESPVLAVAAVLGLDERFGVSWTTQRVPSSPAQFASLRDGEMDVAITSPDNVILYATTDRNPLGEQLPVRFLRPIDRGLGLALYTDPGIRALTELEGRPLGVDVMNSGFALLLLRMLRDAGLDATTMAFEAIGATPKRLGAVLDGTVVGTILNAETAVRAEESGLTRWLASVDVSDDYLGTVLVTMADRDTEGVDGLLALWQEATDFISSAPAARVSELLGASAPALATPAYVALLQSTEFGCVADASVSLEQLRVLADIRTSVGAYAPTDDQLAALLAAH
ncbi:hypothetical protein GCM10009792_09270 [Microcella alkalica]|uniref:ABC-type nitrate/sulfonate/bicarbonate transport system substrate-binding protein n=1 Tax=Microcella alkalica TaxID=355930 RepID=A0A839E8Z9_9MICO|nr:hypothetical protein [Microcella alkalica]MBA8848250.1 ABC-type nitrate/sulfonate/bicarbonate transport system substrate-binding protein [Microcella alkalica]